MSVKINGVPFGNEIFPNNERIFKEGFSDENFCRMYNKNIAMIDFKFETDMDIWKLIVAKKYIDEIYPKYSDKILVMDYIPYSRMDRKIKGYVFSLKYFCELINSMNFDRVEVLDPHSYVSEGMINKIRLKPVGNYVNEVVLRESPDCIFYPDNGALKRYSETFTISPENKKLEYFYGNKKRNLNTGEIIKFELVDAPDLNGKTVLIVDDLCSKGGTFIASANLIKKAGASRVVLYVSHCEESIINGEILKSDLIDKVYTTHSILCDECFKKIEFVD